MFLYNTLCSHRICNLQEACDVSTCYIVTFHAVLLGCIIQIMEDVHHDVLQLGIYFFEGPGKSLTVLAHLQSGGSNTTCIGCFAGAEQNAVLLEVLSSFHGGRHVSALCYSEYAVSYQLLCILQIQFVLGCTGKSYITLHGPYTVLTVLPRGTTAAWSTRPSSHDILHWVLLLHTQSVLHA